MRVTLNLSTPRSTRERYALAWAAPVAVLALAGLVWCLMAVFQTAGVYRKYQQEVGQLEVQENAVRAREVTRRNEFERPEPSQVFREAQFVNGLIERKQFSLTEFAEKVTRLLGPRVRLSGLALIQPASDRVIRFSVVGQSEEDIETFLTKLEDSPDFKEVAIVKQGIEQKGPGEGPVAIDCTARYVGGGPR